MSWPPEELGTNKLVSILTTVSEPEDKEIPLTIQHCIFHSSLAGSQEYTMPGVSLHF